MTRPDDEVLADAANRLVDDREYMTIYAPDPVEPADDSEED